MIHAHYNSGRIPALVVAASPFDFGGWEKYRRLIFFGWRCPSPIRGETGVEVTAGVDRHHGTFRRGGWIDGRLGMKQTHWSTPLPYQILDIDVDLFPPPFFGGLDVIFRSGGRVDDPQMRDAEVSL